MARTFNAIRERFTKLSNNRHIKFGLPLLIFVVGGSFVLEQFAKVRYEFRKVNPYHLPDQGDQMRSNVKPEEEYEKLKQINIKNWDNRRISRPWESEEEPKSGRKSNL